MSSSPGANPGDAIFNRGRCIASNTKTKGYPAHTELSSKKCLDCEAKIKLKHIQRARDCGHRPPDRCYSCLCAKKSKPSMKQRKLARAQRRQREREKLKGIAPP